MALHRKTEALLGLRPDIAVISECAAPDILAARGAKWVDGTSCDWIGGNHNKGLGVFAFNGFKIHRHDPYYPTLRHILPVRVAGPAPFNLLAVWAQNASGGVTRKRQSGPLRRAVTRYDHFLRVGPSVIGGDWNNNAIWDKPGWRINHLPMVARLERMGLASVYHTMTGEAQGAETVPTHYWRDRSKDGPTYHIDHVFVPQAWIHRITAFDIGTFEDWVGARLSDHVPITVTIYPQ